MTEPETFLSIISRLTREHQGWVDTDNGRELKLQDGLLQQLRENVFGGMGGSGGSQFGSKPPIDTAAYDLLDEITTQAAEVLALVDPHPTPYGHAETYVRRWAGQTKDDKVFTVSRIVTDSSTEAEQNDRYKADRHYKATTVKTFDVTAYNLAKRWADKIEEYFDPNLPVAIEAPCPLCEERYVYRQKDGEIVQSAALSFLRDKKTKATISASCAVETCTGYWLPDQFEWLVSAIGITIDGDKLADDMRTTAPVRDIPTLYMAYHQCGYEGPAREDRSRTVIDLDEHLRHAHTA